MRALEKAQKDPESTKARILSAARRIFGEYGFHGTTTRMIAKDAGIDISTLHYHWGEKGDLYEAVILDMSRDLGQVLRSVEKVIHGKPLPERLQISFGLITDYLFEHPEISNLMLMRYFSKTRHETRLDFKVPEFTGDIARSMGLSKDKRDVPPFAMMQVLVIMNSIHNFISGENFFRPLIKIEKAEYVKLVKRTLETMFIAPFLDREENGPKGQPHKPPRNGAAKKQPE
jgi:AcrR family transcriptional regulator